MATHIFFGRTVRAKAGWRAPVPKSKELDVLGKPTAKSLDIQTERNAWDANKLEICQEVARTRLQEAARVSEKATRGQPVFNVYDHATPRLQERDSAMDWDTSHARHKEQSAPRKAARFFNNGGHQS